MPSPEILAVLADEVAEVAEKLAHALADHAAADKPELTTEALERYREPLQRIMETSELLNLEGLRQLCVQIDANLVALDGRELDARRSELLAKWPTLVIGYLRAPQDGVYSRELADHFCDGDWPVPLRADEAEELARQLSTIADISDVDEERARRPVTAQPEDVTLEFPADVNPALIESFLAEAPLQAGAYTSLVEQVIRGGVGPDSLNEARRLIHSIKGAANTVGIRGVAQLAHHLEDLLEYLAQHSITPQGGVAKLLMDAADCLEMMLESLTDQEPAPTQAQAVLQRLLDAANAIDRGQPLETMIPAPAVGPADGETIAPSAERLPEAKTPAAPAADDKRAIRVAAAAIDELLRLSSEMTIGRAHIQENLHQAFALTAELREYHALLQNRATELDRLATVQGVAAGQKRGEPSSPSGIFDALEMDQYSELHGVVHGFLETAADVQTIGTRVLDALAAIDSAVTQQSFVNNDLHELVMRARMVPAAAIAPRLARTVRQVCDATGKQARFELIGGEVMLDDRVVNDLINPLVHLLRNAVDHGLETPAVRARSGKPQEGALRLAFAREGNHIVIRCEDDGAGLDLTRIHGLAVQRGLIPEAAELSDADIARLILLPGFTTHNSVSEISGRGVGMDIVNTGIRKLKGTLDIQTVSGQGCCFTLVLPLTLGSAHCLLVKSAGILCAIPTDNLDHVVYTGALQVERVGAHWVYREENETHDVHDLAELLGYPVERPLGQDDDHRPVIVVKDHEGKQSVIVDQLLSGRDLVIKNLGRYLSGAGGVIGASLLGDGTVLPVLDMRDLLSRRQENSTTVRASQMQPQVAKRPALTDILVVDDSLSVRQALTQLLEDDGYQVHTARDGVEALEYLAHDRPAAMLVDLEMPRMNGLELTQRLREHEETRGLPVIMVTSRSSDKHREQARMAGVDCYLTKPYRETDLLARLRSMLSKAA